MTKYGPAQIDRVIGLVAKCKSRKVAAFIRGMTPGSLQYHVRCAETK